MNEFGPLFSGTLDYNGVRLSYVKTVALSQEPVYDPSRSDLMYFQMRCTFSGYVWKTSNANLFSGASPTEILSRLRDFMLVPRRALKIVFFNDANPFVEASGDNQVGKGIDPLKLDATSILEGCVQVSWEVVIPYLPIGGARVVNITDQKQWTPNIKGFNPIGSLRWKSSQRIAENGMSVITYAGRLLLRIPMEKADPNDFRYLCFPKVAEGFVRKEAVFTVQEDGLGLDFNIVDEERFIMPPDGAFKFSGEFIWASAKMGSQVTGAVSVRLEAYKTTKKSDVVSRAVAIAFETLLARGLAGRVDANGNQSYWVTGTEIREPLHENAVDVRMMANMVRPGAIKNSLPVEYDQYDKLSPVLQQGQARGVSPALYGNVDQLRVLAQLFNDPLLNREWKPPSPSDPTTTRRLVSGPLKEKDPDVGAGTRTIIPVKELPPRTLTTTSNTRAGGPDDARVFEEYQISTTYQPNEARYMLESSAPSLESFTAANPGGPAPTGEVKDYMDSALPVRLGAGGETVEVVFIASKVGSRPRIPSREPSDPNLFLLEASERFLGVDLTLDNLNGVYEVAGRYLYGVKDRSKLQRDNPLYPFVKRLEGEKIEWLRYNPLPAPTQPANPAAAPAAPVA